MALRQADVCPQPLGRERLIDREPGGFRPLVIDHFMDSDVLRRPQLRSSREDWVQEAVASGFGIAIVPEHSALRDDVVLVPVRGLDLTRPVHLLTVFGSATSPAVKALRDAARQYDWPSSKL